MSDDIKNRIMTDCESAACRQLAEAAPIGIARLNPDFLIRWVNPVAARWMGGVGEDLADQPLSRFVMAEHRPALNRLALDLKAGRSRAPRPMALKPAGRPRRHVRFTARPLGEGAADGFIVMFEDLSEGRRIRESFDRKIRDHRRSLRDVESRFHHLFNEMITGVALHEIICDADGKPVDYRFLDVNPAFERLTGYAADQVTGKTVLELMPETEPDWIERYGPVALTRKPTAFEGFSRSMGKHFAVTAFSPETGQFVTTFTDITERKRMEAELREAKEQAEAASRTKSRFLANMSHELRTPLNAVLGITDMATDISTEAPVRENLGLIRKSALSLISLVDDILDFSKIEAGRLRLRCVDFDPRSCLKEIRRMFDPEIRRKKLGFEITVAHDVPPVARGDPDRLGQVLKNLLANAIKFTDRGRIDLSVTRDPGQVDAGKVDTGQIDAGQGDADGPIVLRFSVRDTGIGIPPHLRNRLFKSFERLETDVQLDHAGSGLGLAISRRLVEMMGGGIWVTDTPGGGSAFHFTVRLQAPETRDAAAFASAAGAVSAGVQAAGYKEAGGARYRLLLAEDNVLNQHFIVYFLTKAGHRVDTSGDGREALSKLAEDRYDAVLMDIRMPGMDGIEATRRIRAGENERIPPDLPVIALTAYALKGDQERFMAAGMNAYVPKPVNMNRLLAAIQAVVAPEAEAGAPAAPDKMVWEDDTDIEQFLDLFRRDPSTLRRILKGFSQESHRTMATLDKAMADGAIQTAADAAHSLANLAVAVRALGAVGEARNLEEAIRDGRQEATLRLRRSVRDHFRRINRLVSRCLDEGAAPPPGDE